LIFASLACLLSFGCGSVDTKPDQPGAGGDGSGGAGAQPEGPYCPGPSATNGRIK
jgi:hypothetical protein